MPQPVLLANAPRARRSGVLVGAAWMAAWLTLTLVPPSASRLLTWPFAAAAWAVWLTPLLILPALIISRQIALPGPMVTAGLGLLALGSVASAAASPFAEASLPHVWPLLGGAAFGWVLHSLRVTHRAILTDERCAFGFALTGAALLAASFAGWSGFRWPLPWGSRNIFPFGHSTYTAAAIVAVLPWLILQASRTRAWQRTAWSLATGLSLLLLVSTSSRGGVLALVVVIGAAVLALLFSTTWSWRKKLLVLTAVVAVGAGAIVANPRLRDRVVGGTWSEAARESDAQRAAMLSAGLELGRQRPLLGWGPGSVPWVYPRVRAALDGGTENVLQLHSTPAQAWATLGACGILAGTLLVIGILRAARRVGRGAVTAAALASLLASATMSLTDHSLDLPFFACWCAAQAAMITSAAAAPTASDGRRRFAVIGTATLLLVSTLVAMPATWRDLAARRVYDRALNQLEQGNTEAFLTLLKRAQVIAPHDPFYPQQAAAELLRQRAQISDPAARITLAQRAADQLRASLATGVHEEIARFNLGWLALELGHPADAAQHFRAAAQLVPDKGGVYFGLGLAYLALERRDAAIRAFALEWINDPRHATSPAWETPALVALIDPVRTEATRLLATLASGSSPTSGAGSAAGTPSLHAWLRWLWAPTHELVAPLPADGFNAATRRLRALLSQPTPRQFSSPQTPWETAFDAWKTRDAAAFAELSRGDPAFAAALARRAEKYRHDFRAFLLAPAGEEPALTLTFARQRRGHGVLAGHPEGPVFSDAYVVQENRVVTEFASELFPRKGWLPGRFLLALLPEAPR